MKQNFHQSIQQGKLSAATDILLNGRIDEDIFMSLTIVKMRLSIIERAITLGCIDFDKGLELKTKIALQLMRIHDEIQNVENVSTSAHPHISTPLTSPE